EQLTIGNDQLSSLRVPEGWRVTLFSDARFSGMEKTFTSDTPWVGDDFNDITSAVLVEGPDRQREPVEGPDLDSEAQGEAFSIQSYNCPMLFVRHANFLAKI